MTVGLIALAIAIQAAQHGRHGICFMALLAMLFAFFFVRLPR